LGHSNIAQTSTYLETQAVGQNDLMRRFEERQAILQNLANASRKTGRKRLQSGVIADSRPSKGSRKQQVQ
jgi:hypothetical protein